LLLEEKIFRQEKNVLLLNQEKFSWHQKSFVTEEFIKENLIVFVQMQFF